MVRSNLIRAVCGLILLTAAFNAAAETVSFSLGLIPASGGCNTLAFTLTATYLGIPKSDSETSTATGTLLGRVETIFDPLTGVPLTVTGLEFTGGDLALSDVAFRLNYGFLLGSVYVNGSGLGGTADTPIPPGPVTGRNFDTLWHELIINRGLLDAYGTNIIGGVFEPTTVNLAESPLNATSPGTGQIELELISTSGHSATYSMNLTIPVDFDEIAMDDTGMAVHITGQGALCASGQFNRTFCPLAGDLTGDCQVDLQDLTVLAWEWLLSSPNPTCPLRAERAGGDCYIDLLDFQIVANDWLR